MCPWESLNLYLKIPTRISQKNIAMGTILETESSKYMEKSEKKHSHVAQHRLHIGFRCWTTSTWEKLPDKSWVVVPCGSLLGGECFNMPYGGILREGGNTGFLNSVYYRYRTPFLWVSVSHTDTGIAVLRFRSVSVSITGHQRRQFHSFCPNFDTRQQLTTSINNL